MAPARLRLCSDDQLVERYRAGRDEAFRVIHDRYRARLGAYVRQMLAARSSEDVEDVLQDVFERAARMLRSSTTAVGLRPWLYGVARNRCIDELRRRPPAPPDVLAATRPPLDETSAVAERRADVDRLFRDLRMLPELQRSALLMRELQGLSHAELAEACGVTVPAVKSLLVRARVGLVDADAARGAACATIRDDLAATHDRSVKTSARAARHLRECTACRSYRAELRRTSRRLAGLIPGPTLLPLAALGRLLGSAGDTPLAATGAVGSGGGAIVGAGKVAAVLSVASVAATGAVLAPGGTFGGGPSTGPAARQAEGRPTAAPGLRLLKAANVTVDGRRPHGSAQPLVAPAAGRPRPAAAPDGVGAAPGGQAPTPARAPAADPGSGPGSATATPSRGAAPAAPPSDAGASPVQQPAAPGPGAPGSGPTVSDGAGAAGPPASGSSPAPAPIPALAAAATGATGLATGVVGAVPSPLSSVAATVTPAASQLTGLVPGAS